MTAGDRWGHCRGAAQRVLRSYERHGATEQALPFVERVFSAFGFQIAQVDAGDPLLGGGWAALYPDLQLAACDRALPPARQAFSLAHELGHLVLHVHVRVIGDPSPANGREAVLASCLETDIDADRAGAAQAEIGYARPEEIYNPRQQREVEASVFALELLAPPALLRRLFVEESHDAPVIARMLGLSYTATLQALGNLLGAERQNEPHARTGALDDRDDGPCLDGHDAYAPDLPRHPHLRDGDSIQEKDSPAPQTLDASQIAASMTTEGVLVEAGPGSGKTSALLARLSWLVREQSIPPGAILALTYSNRAAADLQGRLAVWGEPVNSIAVYTIHSFAHELLRRYASAIELSASFQILDRPAALVLTRRHLPDLLRRLRETGEQISIDRPLPALSRLLDEVSRLKDSMVGPADLAAFAVGANDEDEGATLLSTFYPWYTGLCAARNALDYGDLLLLAIRLLRTMPAIREEVRQAYAEVLVDEMQDINPACAEFLALLAPPTGLWAVGDPLQAIYRWRGAVPGALGSTLRIAHAAGGLPSTMKLDVNYRSRGPIVRLCGALAAAIEGVNATTSRDRWRAARDQSGEPAAAVVVAVATDQEAELDGIARSVRLGLDSGSSLRDHAVLCATNAQADAIAAGLARRGIPVSRAVHPEDDWSVRRALCILDLAAGRPEALLGLTIREDATGRAESTEAAAPALARTAAGYDGLGMADAHHLVREASALDGHLLEILEAAPGPISMPGRQYTRTLARFLRSLPAARSAPQDGAGRAWPSLAKYLFDAPFAAARPIIAAEARASAHALRALLAAARAYDQEPPELRERTLTDQITLLLSAGIGLRSDALDVSAEGVRVLTVHAAKGQEFPVVFVPNLAKGRFPARGRGRESTAARLLGGDDVAARLDDDRAMFFVAVSRARDRLSLSRAQVYGGRAYEPSPMLALLEPAFAAEAPSLEYWQRDDMPVSLDQDTASTAKLDQARDRTNENAMSAGVEVDQYALETYLDCPKRYYYVYNLGIEGTDGQGYRHFHSTLRRVLHRIALTQDPSTEDARAILDEEWALDRGEHPHEDFYFDRALRAASAAVARALTDSTPGWSEYDAVLPVDFANGRVLVHVDRLDHIPGASPVAARLRSGRPSDGHRREPRVALYQAALDAAYGGGSVRQEYLLTGAVDTSRARPTTLESRLRQCDEALAAIAAEEFSPRPAERCADCPFWLICPQG